MSAEKADDRQTAFNLWMPLPKTAMPKRNIMSPEGRGPGLPGRALGGAAGAAPPYTSP